MPEKKGGMKTQCFTKAFYRKKTNLSDELIETGKEKISQMYSSLRIENEKKLIVWDAFLPTTLPAMEKEYDPEYFKKIKKNIKKQWLL